jgi:hypothetical protein
MPFMTELLEHFLVVRLVMLLVWTIYIGIAQIIRHHIRRLLLLAVVARIIVGGVDKRCLAHAQQSRLVG